jgi:hypothetical protein
MPKAYWVSAYRATRESAAYQEALLALSDGVDRDFRIVEGIE